ncbi:low affinity iron permease family protein [Rhizobium sp. LjRoot30]|uniref:low affinity iron permease family protein n=1 Tax=Rhizobium sp. LjRoot30 TaxID=3342320 RepID=UPI003ECEEF9C
MRISDFFCRFSNAVAEASGKPATFVLAVGVILAWAVSGPLFGFSETWQLVVNTGTTIVTFLMVFILQNSQNRDGKALQAKLDELILTSSAENRFIGIENLDENELRRLTQMLKEAADSEPDNHLERKISRLVRKNALDQAG